MNRLSSKLTNCCASHTKAFPLSSYIRSATSGTAIPTNDDNANDSSQLPVWMPWVAKKRNNRPLEKQCSHHCNLTHIDHHGTPDGSISTSPYSATAHRRTYLLPMSHSMLTATMTSAIQRNATPAPVHATRRYMAANARNNRGRKNKQNQQQQPLINEFLIRELLTRQSKQSDGNANAETLQVRLLVDANDGKKATNASGNKKPNTDVQLLSLSEAITIATTNSVDLVGISLQQAIPVLRAIDYSKFIYEQSSKQNNNSNSKNNNNNSSSSNQKKSNKEYTFRAGIDNDDLQRKVKNMVKYLQKGHSCHVSITSNRRNLMSDENVIQTTLQRVMDFVGENGAPQGKIKINPYGNRGSLLFQPKSKNKK